MIVCVQRFSAKGKFQLNWGQIGSNNGQFWTPVGICVDGIETRLITINKIICLSI